MVHTHNGCSRDIFEVLFGTGPEIGNIDASLGRMYSQERGLDTTL
jgi:hypothetical protein